MSEIQGGEAPSAEAFDGVYLPQNILNEIRLASFGLRRDHVAHMRPLPVSHLSPVETVYHDDGSTAFVFDGYKPPLATAVPVCTPTGTALPATFTPAQILLRGLGKDCIWNAEKRCADNLVEDALIQILESQGVQVVSKTNVFSVGLFDLSDVLRRPVTRSVMLLPSVSRLVMSDVNDSLSYLLGYFSAQKKYCREWVFNGGRHLLFRPGQSSMEAGLKLRDILREFQCSVGRILRDKRILGTELVPMLRKTEGCFFTDPSGEVWVHLHAHAVILMKERVEKQEWKNRLVLARESMGNRKVPGGGRWPGYVHDQKLGRKGAAYILKATQKLTSLEIKKKKHASKEVPLLHLPPVAVAAWAIACYRTHMVQSLGPLAELRATLAGNPQHNLPARKLVRVTPYSARRQVFRLRWKSDEPKDVDPDTKLFGIDTYRNREGYYVETKVAPPKEEKPLGWTSANTLFERPKGLLRRAPENDQELHDVRLLTVSRPAPSRKGRLQNRIIIASERSSLSHQTKKWMRREALKLLRDRVCGLREFERYENPGERKRKIGIFWKNLAARFYRRQHRLLYLDPYQEKSPQTCHQEHWDPDQMAAGPP